MASLWPWLAVAGLGALHGLNPASGWMWAAAWGVRSRDRAQRLRALIPIAFGHLASVALVGAAVVFGLSFDPVVMQAVAGGLFALLVIAHLSGRTPLLARAPAGHAGLALWSFMMSSAHGAGLMLVPALIPLCMESASAREIGAGGLLAPVLAAVGIHTAAMLAVTAVMASGAGRALDRAARLLRDRKTGPHPVPGGAAPAGGES